jgi:hypothetical protein
MRKIIGYKIVREQARLCDSESSFEADVNALIKEGWRPLGAPGVYSQFDEHYQALVLYEPDDESFLSKFGLTSKTNSRGPG